MTSEQGGPRARRDRDRPASTPLHRFGNRLARHPRPVIAAWVALVVAGAVLLPRFEGRLTGPPFRVDGSQSARAQSEIETRFDLPVAEQDLIIFQSDTLTANDPAFRRVVTAADEKVGALALVSDVIGPDDPRATDQVSTDGHTAVAVVALRGTAPERQHMAPTLAAAVRSAASADVRVYVTGKSFLVDDLVDQEHADLARAERLGLPVALLILLAISGSVVAAVLPLLLAGVGIVVAFGVLGAATRFTSFHLFVPNVATMMGLGVGIDYSLLMVTRFREGMARRDDPAAAARAVAGAGRTIWLSGTTVVLSLAGLFAVDAPIFRQLAVGAIVTVAVMVGAAMTLLPAALVVLGPGVERFALPLPRSWLGHTGRPDGLAARWARTVMRHPIPAAIAASLVLLALAFPITGLRLGLSTGTEELTNRQAARGRAIPEHHFDAGDVAPIRVVVTSRDGPLDAADLGTIARLTTALSTDPQAARVTSVTSVLDRVAGSHAPSLLATAVAMPGASSALGELVNVGHGADTAVIYVVPAGPPDHDAAIAFVRRIRADIVPSVVD